MLTQAEEAKSLDVERDPEEFAPEPAAPYAYIR
jgi:hypothetical protein